jgi:hypothetical protein
MEFEVPPRDNEVSPLKIDRQSPEIMSALATAPIYEKYGRVKARRAIAGEEITTILENGATETVGRANPSDWVITNPGGEQYIISDKKFLARYEATDEAGVYRAMGYCRAIPNNFDGPIEMNSSLGSVRRGDETSFIADHCDAKGNLAGSPYIIDDEAFFETYKLAGKSN